MVVLDNLIITPYHPIKVENTWTFPVEIAKVTNVYISDFYNFVLESGHSVLVEGVECVTLAHNLDEAVVKHEYLGTDMILRDLRKLEGWSRGHIDVRGFERDGRTKLICGIIA